MTRKKPNVKYDPGLALQVADSFRKGSQVLIDKIGKDTKIAIDIAANDVGGISVSATTLALSIELYLKGLISLVNTCVPRGHDLLSLYNALPNELRRSIEESYGKMELKGQTTKTHHPAELSLALRPDNVSKKDQNESGKNNPHKKRDYSITSVLERSKDMFPTWRYLHEVKDGDSIVIYAYEFERLGLIADSLQDHLISLLKRALLENKDR